ncbi:hydrolase [Legionella busanensis]|uniref:Hydrolase n=1 Tax=Legionella busanensis TaxID=190655 RepID=A0A378JN28_9GAMM|nr:alpha/beta hydrolase [Legionella busanensis]STX52654.1 hydrolase [Legionella busanensis]
MKEQRFQYKDIELNVMEGPKHGLPILLLHGATKNWQVFKPIIEELVHYLYVLAIDFRGHGKSKHVPGAYKLQDYLLDTHCFIKEYIKEPSIILGHSLGGMIGLMTAAHYPKLVRALIMLDAPLTTAALKRLITEQGEFANHLIQWLKVSRLLNISSFNNIHIPESLAQCDPDMLHAMINDFEATFHQYSIDELFPKIKCPLLIIRGNPKIGSLVEDHEVMQVKALLSDFTDIKLPYAGHSPINHDKRAVLKAINVFLRQYFKI